MVSPAGLGGAVLLFFSVFSLSWDLNIHILRLSVLEKKNPHHQQSAETAARNSYWSNALRINASTSQRDRKESKRWGRSAGSHSEVSSRQAWFMHGQYGHPCPACPVLWLTGGSDTPAPAVGDTPSPGAQPGSTDSGTGV